MITKSQLVLKRGFDIVLGLILLPIFMIPIISLVCIATIDLKQFGLFYQARVGQHGVLFKIFKIRSLKEVPLQFGDFEDSATTFGKFLRATKLDELPQLFNVIIGDMSFVGPRPDVQGFADELKGADRIILKVKPGITGSATLKYRNEDLILSKKIDPETYNKTVIWADKVLINKNYVQNWSFYLDLNLIIKSIVNGL